MSSPHGICASVAFNRLTYINVNINMKISIYIYIYIHTYIYFSYSDVAGPYTVVTLWRMCIDSSILCFNYAVSDSVHVAEPYTVITS